MPQYEDVYEPPILDATAQAIANAILGLNPPIPSFISDAFSVERSYSTGDIVIYENKVYVFTSDKSAGAWDSTKVTETTIGAICTATNASLTQLEQTITLTASQGSTIFRLSGCRVGSLVGFSCEITTTASANTWTELATVNFNPTSLVEVPAVKPTDGSYLGMVQITTSGVIRIYPKSAISAQQCGFTVNYKTT